MEDFLWEILYCFLYGPISVISYLLGRLVQFIEDLPEIPKAIAEGFKRGVEAGKNGISIKEAVEAYKKELLEEN